MTGHLERIGVIGDIHAEDVYLGRAIATLDSHGVDAIVATGDIPDGAGSVDACCALLSENRVVTVGGNHDRWFLAGAARDLPEATQLGRVSEGSQSFLESLPRMVELGTVSGLALLCHGIGPNVMAKVGPDDHGYALENNDDLHNLLRDGSYRWLINGHSHQRVIRPFPGLTIINAGTLKRDQSPCFLEVDFRERRVLVFEFDNDGVIHTNSMPLP
jgi:predicted phosphodiesterase